MSASVSIIVALKWATEQLTSDSPRLDAELLLAHVLQQSRTWLITWSEKLLTKQQQQTFEGLIAQRRQGRPVAHLLGSAGFWSLELSVNEHTLIPRPETEILVETALAHIPPEANWVIADLGTGSGAIALALSSERPLCTVHAVERSTAALKIARQNASALGLNVQFHPGSWFEPLADMLFDLIVSNPPYIPEQDLHLNQGDVRFEPGTALSSGADGLDDIRHIIHTARQYLKPGGWLMLEHGYDQGEAVVQLLRAEGYQRVDTIPDLSGQPRVGLGRYR
ncbi:MAG: peptide chain release factor N(5)-glutamine methyltransferase [Gammaproteobacteria bacterium]|nr:peptide chain release factor N(5)-glutamine methyltransferase [Gammaproteobacteria bacterium]